MKTLIVMILIVECAVGFYFAHLNEMEARARFNNNAITAYIKGE